MITAPGPIRTADNLLRSEVLYPSELQAHTKDLPAYSISPCRVAAFCHLQGQAQNIVAKRQVHSTQHLLMSSRCDKVPIPAESVSLSSLQSGGFLPPARAGAYLGSANSGGSYRRPEALASGTTRRPRWSSLRILKIYRPIPFNHSSWVCSLPFFPLFSHAIPNEKVPQDA